MSREKNNIIGSFKEQLDKNTIDKINSLYEKISLESEFEFMFFNYKQDKNRMGLENFLKILEYLTYSSNKNKIKLETINSLDIGYNTSSGTYRITINTIDSINKYIKMLYMRKNHVIFSILANLYDKDDKIKLIKKIKDKENIIDINDFDIRVRLSEETIVSKQELTNLVKLDETTRNDIIFRYKQRISLKIEETKEMTISIDLTNIKMSKNLNNLEESISIYELEIDTTSKTKNPNKKYLDKIYDEINILLKIIQQSNFIISRTLENDVLNQYGKLLNIKNDAMISLEARKPQSLEVQHVVDQLPNKYAVTDKADGQRYFLIIYDQSVYLISDLLNVKSTGIKLSNKDYDNSIIDGELIFIQSENKYIFMGFDCLYKGNQDIRQISTLNERLQNLDEIIENCFINKNHKGFNHKNYNGKFDLNSIIDYHDKQIKEFMDSLNHDIKVTKLFTLIRRKYFISAIGGQNNEIFKYSLLIWNKYTHDKSINCPYILDGLVYHPLDQKYIISVKDSKFLEYKWKPENKNSIDFYVQYERNKETKKIVTLYDNSREEDEQIRGKPYKILKLYVGKIIKSIEQPILFEPELDSIKYLAYIFLQDGQIKDLEDNIIQDNTVVEFYYNNDPNIPDKHRWVPMRTRYDKTESVQRFGKKYGNYSDISYKVWRSIKNPFTISDINLLSQDEIYDKHIDILRGKIDHSVILSERKENIYYQIRTTLGKPMRNYHNWIKSILMYTYLNSMYENNKKLSVLDIACGRGGDIMRYYYVEVDFMVGIDIDNNGIISPVDGALSRYEKFRKSKPNFPRMFFIHADGGVLLNYDDQYKALGGMSEKNKNMMNKFFSKDSNKRTQFDRISCQFAIHYFFENDIILNNFMQNIKDYLKEGGFLLATTFDAQRIMKLLDNKSQYTQYYTNTNGEQKVLFEIIKKYENISLDKEFGAGVAIDFHNAIDFQEGFYKTEYLVDKKFIAREFLEKCNMELIETDLFENQFILNKEFLTNSYKLESKEETKNFLKNVAEFYNQNLDINNASYQLTKLYRFYVFRKKDHNNKPIKINKKIKQKGGLYSVNLASTDYIFNDITSFFNPKKFIKRDLHNFKDFSFIQSIHNILQNHHIIPKNISMMEFCDDIDFKICNDRNLNKDKISQLNKNLVIKHDYSIELSSEMALDGLNILIVKKDSIEKHGTSVLLPSIILYYDGNKYYPIYKKSNDQLIGIFDTNTDIIMNLLIH